MFLNDLCLVVAFINDLDYILWLLKMIATNHIVLAIDAFTLISARNVPFVAFTVFLLTSRCFTSATSKVLALFYINLVFKSFDIPLENLLHSLFPFFIALLEVVTDVITFNLSAPTFRSASCFVTKTDAVKLQALVVLASASLTLGILLDQLRKVLLLCHSFIQYFLGHLKNFPFILSIQKFFFLSRHPCALWWFYCTTIWCHHL